MSRVRSFSVGEGDMFYIKHNSDNFTTIDCCNSSALNRLAIFHEIQNESNGKNINRFISTHPDDDHIRGLKEYDDKFGILNFYCVDNDTTKEDVTDDFKTYCNLRDGEKHFYLYKGCQRKWMNVSDNERGSAGINCLWPITSDSDYKQALNDARDGKSPNNISPIITYSIEDGAKFMWMGDLEHDFQEKIKDKISWPSIDILFAPHHGRDSGKVPEDVLKALSPKIIVIGEAPSKDLNYYQGYNTITQNTAGDITFECTGNLVHVYVSSEIYSVNYLRNTNHPESRGNYIGTLVVL